MRAQKIKNNVAASGGAMNFSCLATISSSAGDVGMAAGIATDPETAYTVTFNTDNGNAGTLTARIIHYNNSSHTTYTLLKEISVSRSSQNHISFTATADSVWLWVGHKANGTNLAAGTSFKVTSGSMLRYTWSVAQSHIQSYLYNYGAYRFAYNGQERTDEKAGKGNFYTAKFWEYSSRTGDRGLPDPKPTFGISPYAVFGGNPILFSDPLGNTVTTKTAEANADVKEYSKKNKEFAGWIDKWDKDKDINVNITTDINDITPHLISKLKDEEGGTIAYGGETDGVKQYYVYYNADPELKKNLGASGILEESYHLKDAMEDVHMGFRPASEGKYGVAGVDIYDEVRAKKWVANSGAINLTIPIRGSGKDKNGNTNIFNFSTHYGYIKKFKTDEGIKNFLMIKRDKDVESITMPLMINRDFTTPDEKMTRQAYGSGKYSGFSAEPKSPNP